MTDEQALEVAAKATDAAQGRGLQVAVAVVDAAGLLLAFRRHDDAFPASVDLAIGKARTAASFRRSTQAMQESLEQGRASYLAMPGALPLAGGVPLVSRGAVIGALGISGASSRDDAELAVAAARDAGWAGDPA
ncbi:GlcG/HbpS family heme-binding protein [Paracidovorax anthurii]|uniref:Glc operon protein GlcG n=1 Tax=Paracidovorax anthurii TaxID=78229 RepID=A0A328Z4D8_9BURK|nr:heme-binding protein [Paracidovorax anthurii]RAR81000.1 glc operon protein GlcG [Paracidovorax anthurii]